MNTPKSLEIDRSKPFNPMKFADPDGSLNCYDGYSIWRGHADGDGSEGEEEQDVRSLLVTNLDPTKLIVQNGYGPEDDLNTLLGGEAKRTKLLLNPQTVQADAKIGETLYREKDHTTLKWIKQTFNVDWIEFLGTTIRCPTGKGKIRREVLCLYEDNQGTWVADYNWLRHGRGPRRKALGIKI